MIIPLPKNFLRNLRLGFRKEISNSDSPHVAYKSIGGTHITQIFNSPENKDTVEAATTIEPANLPRPLPKIQPKETAIYIPMDGELRRIPTQEELDLVQMIRKNTPYNTITDVGIVLNEDGTIDKLQWNET